MPDTAPIIATAIELALAAIGCLLLWRLVLCPRARAARVPSPLSPWDATPLDLLMFILHILAGGIIASFIAALLVKPLGLTGDRLIVFSNMAGQLGLLGGVSLFCLSYPGRFNAAVARPQRMLWSGLATFLIAMPFVVASGIAWSALLELCGLPVEKQLAVDLFTRIDSTPWLAAFGVTAVVIAPISEELIFRAGMFRYLRTRLPRWAGLLLPAFLFAALHQNLASYVQLAVLGIVFALAYERTGHIATPIIAHAAFNLSNVLLLLAGANR